MNRKLALKISAVLGLGLFVTGLVFLILFLTSKDCMYDTMDCPINGGTVKKTIKQHKSGFFGKKCVDPLVEYRCKIGDGKFLTHMYTGCSKCRSTYTEKVFPGCGTPSNPVMRPFSFCEDKNGPYWGSGWAKRGDANYSITNKTNINLASYQKKAADRKEVYSCTDILRPDGTQIFTKISSGSEEVCKDTAPSSLEV